MKKHLAYTLLLLFVTLYSCRKDSSTPPLSDLNLTNRDITVNLTYTDNFDSLHKDQWELIISEAAGKVLLDTVAPVNTALRANLHLNVYEVNVTSVFYNAALNRYNVTTYRNVNPQAWTALPSPYLNIPQEDTLSPTVATTYYTHPPYLSNFESSDFNDILVSDNTISVGLPAASNYQPSDPAYQPGGLLTAYSFHYGNNSTYLLFPQLGLYNFHTPPATGNDTVDLTHMDTAVMINYSLPPTFNMLSTNLFGYTDTTNLSRSMLLFENDYGSYFQYPADLEYPPSGVQAYFSEIQGVNNNTDEYIGYFTYGTKVPSSINWPTTANYTVHANLQDSFAVSFNGVSPAYYTMNWQSANIYFEIYSAADGATLHPYTWFTHLASKLLQGQSIPSLTPSFFYFVQSVGLPSDYNGYLNVFATTAAPITVPLGTAVTAYDKYL